MRTDRIIRDEVEEELRSTPEVNETDVAVTVHDACVFLSGFVHSYLESTKAEEAAKRVAGVRGVANDLEVRLPELNRPTDPEIARAVVVALKQRLPKSYATIRTIVEHGRVTLEGDVERNGPRELAVTAIRSLPGVVTVFNNIKVKPRLKPLDLKRQIEEAFKRTTRLKADRVHVSAKEGEVTLSGEVHTWAERDQAARTAWCAPGVVTVKNQITVQPCESSHPDNLLH